MSVYSYGPQGPDGQGYHSQGNRRAGGEKTCRPNVCYYDTRCAQRRKETKSKFCQNTDAQANKCGRRQKTPCNGQNAAARRLEYRIQPTRYRSRRAVTVSPLLSVTAATSSASLCGAA